MIKSKSILVEPVIKVEALVVADAPPPPPVVIDVVVDGVVVMTTVLVVDFSTILALVDSGMDGAGMFS